MKDHVFVLRGPDGSEEWKASMDGHVLPVEWNSRGAAEAGLQAERRRRTSCKAREAPCTAQGSDATLGSGRPPQEPLQAPPGAPPGSLQGVPRWAVQADRRQARRAYVEAMGELPTRVLEQLCRQLKLARHRVRRHPLPLLLWHHVGRDRWLEYQRSLP